MNIRTQKIRTQLFFSEEEGRWETMCRSYRGKKETEHPFGVVVSRNGHGIELVRRNGDFFTVCVVGEQPTPDGKGTIYRLKLVD